MGERGQILIKDTGVYLYTHWEGYRLKQILQRALRRKLRWDDVEYLTRIIFEEMLQGSNDIETGYGIGNIEHGDLGYDVVVVDCNNQTVTESQTSWTFDNFIEMEMKDDDE